MPTVNEHCCHDADHHLAEIVSAASGNPAARWRAVEACRDYLHLVTRNGHWFHGEGVLAPSDLVQNALLAGWRDFEKFRGHTPGHLRAWLRGILVHAALNAHHRRGPVSRSPEILDVQPAKDASPSQVVLKADAAAALDRALETLPDHYRAAIQLRIWSRLSFRTVGVRLGLSEDAARMLFGRAIVRLRELMSADHEPA